MDACHVLNKWDFAEIRHTPRGCSSKRHHHQHLVLQHSHSKSGRLDQEGELIRTPCVGLSSLTFISSPQGLPDLLSSSPLIRTPLEPLQTFLDDPLRILRCIRFASRFNFPLDTSIKPAVEDERVKVCLKSFQLAATFADSPL